MRHYLTNYCSIFLLSILSFVLNALCKLYKTTSIANEEQYQSTFIAIWKQKIHDPNQFWFKLKWIPWNYYTSILKSSTTCKRMFDEDILQFFVCEKYLNVYRAKVHWTNNFFFLENISNVCAEIMEYVYCWHHAVHQLSQKKFDDSIC